MATNICRDALVDFSGDSIFRTDAVIAVGMGINKSGTQGKVPCIHDLPGWFTCYIQSNTSVFDTHVSPVGRFAAAINDLRATK